MKELLILGATSDMAIATAYIFAEDNYNLILAGRDIARLEPLSKDLQLKHKIAVELIELDVRIEDQREVLFKKIQSPDIVISYLGYLGDNEAALQDKEEAIKTIGLNYTNIVIILNHFALLMEKEKKGIIAGVSSVAGERGRQSNFMYGSAKAGFTQYLSGLRNRLYRSGVHVVTVKPGFVYTKMTEGLELPKPLTASPEQVAKDIYKAVIKKKNIVYTLWFWYFIMLIIRNIPEQIFKKLKL